MLGYKRFVIADHERGMHFKNRSFQSVLMPGIHRFFDLRNHHAVEVFDLNRAEFSHPLFDNLRKRHPQTCAAHFQLVETSARQVALIYQNEHLTGVLSPDNRTVYWREGVDTRAEILDIDEQPRIEPKLAAQLARPRPGVNTADAVTSVEVPDHHAGLLLIDGALRETLKPGFYAFWRYFRNIQVEVIDLRMRAMEVQGQEILTQDKVSLRVNLSAHFRVADPVKARGELGAYPEFLYRELQFALRQAVSSRTLDGLLGDKNELEQVIFATVAQRAEPFGLSVNSVGIKDVILPGDMKEILNQVVEAEKAAQANLIKRREETAAARSLLNTAKLMSENPVLLRLKELEMLEKVTDNVGNLTVFGGLEGVLKDTVRIQVPGG